jgi:hypothetical protein
MGRRSRWKQLIGQAFGAEMEIGETIENFNLRVKPDMKAIPETVMVEFSLRTQTQTLDIDGLDHTKEPKVEEEWAALQRKFARLSERKRHGIFMGDTEVTWKHLPGQRVTIVPKNIPAAKETALQNPEEHQVTAKLAPPLNVKATVPVPQVHPAPQPAQTQTCPPHHQVIRSESKIKQDKLEVDPLDRWIDVSDKIAKKFDMPKWAPFKIKPVDGDIDVQTPQGGPDVSAFDWNEGMQYWWTCEYDTF